MGADGLQCFEDGASVFLGGLSNFHHDLRTERCVGIQFGKRQGGSSVILCSTHCKAAFRRTGINSPSTNASQAAERGWSQRVNTSRTDSKTNRATCVRCHATVLVPADHRLTSSCCYADATAWVGQGPQQQCWTYGEWCTCSACQLRVGAADTRHWTPPCLVEGQDMTQDTHKKSQDRVLAGYKGLQNTSRARFVSFSCHERNTQCNSNERPRWSRPETTEHAM